jgi:hypothetical protein
MADMAVPISRNGVNSESNGVLEEATARQPTRMSSSRASFANPPPRPKPPVLMAESPSAGHVKNAIGMYAQLTSGRLSGGSGEVKPFLFPRKKLDMKRMPPVRANEVPVARRRSSREISNFTSSDLIGRNQNESTNDGDEKRDDRQDLDKSTNNALEISDDTETKRLGDSLPKEAVEKLIERERIDESIDEGDIVVAEKSPLYPNVEQDHCVEPTSISDKRVGKENTFEQIVFSDNDHIDDGCAVCSASEISERKSLSHQNQSSKGSLSGHKSSKGSLSGHTQSGEDGVEDSQMRASTMDGPVEKIQDLSVIIDNRIEEEEPPKERGPAADSSEEVPRAQDFVVALIDIAGEGSIKSDLERQLSAESSHSSNRRSLTRSFSESTLSSISSELPSEKSTRIRRTKSRSPPRPSRSVRNTLTKEMEALERRQNKVAMLISNFSTHNVVSSDVNAEKDSATKPSRRGVTKQSSPAASGSGDVTVRQVHVRDKKLDTLFSPIKIMALDGDQSGNASPVVSKAERPPKMSAVDMHSPKPLVADLQTSVQFSPEAGSVTDEEGSTIVEEIEEVTVDEESYYEEEIPESPPASPVNRAYKMYEGSFASLGLEFNSPESIKNKVVLDFRAMEPSSLVKKQQLQVVNDLQILMSKAKAEKEIEKQISINKHRLRVLTDLETLMKRSKVAKEIENQVSLKNQRIRVLVDLEKLVEEKAKAHEETEKQKSMKEKMLSDLIETSKTWNLLDDNRRESKVDLSTEKVAGLITHINSCDKANTSVRWELLGDLVYTEGVEEVARVEKPFENSIFSIQDMRDNFQDTTSTQNHPRDVQLKTTPRVSDMTTEDFLLTKDAEPEKTFGEDNDVGDEEEAVETFRRQYNLSEEDMADIVAHLELCEETNTEVRWDLINQIIYPDDNVSLSQGAMAHPSRDLGDHPSAATDFSDSVTSGFSIYPELSDSVVSDVTFLTEAEATEFGNIANKRASKVHPGLTRRDSFKRVGSLGRIEEFQQADSLHAITQPPVLRNNDTGRRTSSRPSSFVSKLVQAADKNVPDPLLKQRVSSQPPVLRNNDTGRRTSSRPSSFVSKLVQAADKNVPDPLLKQRVSSLWESKISAKNPPVRGPFYKSLSSDNLATLTISPEKEDEDSSLTSGHEPSKFLSLLSSGDLDQGVTESPKKNPDSPVPADHDDSKNEYFYQSIRSSGFDEYSVDEEVEVFAEDEESDTQYS